MTKPVTIQGLSIAMRVEINVPNQALEIDADAYRKADPVNRTVMVMMAGVSPTEAANVVAELDKLFPSQPQPVAATPSPFDLLGDLSAAATQVYFDPQHMVMLSEAATVLGPGLVSLPAKVRQAAKKGLTWVKDPWVKQVLGQYDVVSQQAGGGIMQLSVNAKYGVTTPMMINILPANMAQGVVASIMDVWTRSPMDQALRAAKEYADLRSKDQGARAAGVTMHANASDVGATVDEVWADLIDALNAVTGIMSQGLLDTRSEMMAKELAYIVMPALMDEGFVHNNMGIPVQTGQNPFQQFLNASGPDGAAMNMALAMRKAATEVANLNQASDREAFVVGLGTIGQEYSRAVTRFHRYAPRQTVTPSGFTGVTSVAVDLRAMISVDTTGRIQVDVTSSTTVTQGPIVIDWFNEAYKAVEFDGFATTGSPFSVGSWSQFSARVEGDKLVIMRGRNEYRASNSAEFKIALERVTGSTFTDNDAHKALQELTSRGLTKTLRGQGQPNIQNLVVELGMDWDNLAGATKDAKVNSLVDTVRRAGRVENLYLAMIRIGILG